MITPESSWNLDALVTLAGAGYSEDGRIGKDSVRRTLTAAELYHEGIAPNVVVSGGYPSLGRERPSNLADQMAEILSGEGVPENNIFIENRSVDTFGNALLVKREIVDPNEWRKLGIVTDDDHLKRAKRAFGYVFGSKYSLEGFSAGESLYNKQLINEILGTVASAALTFGVRLGDDTTISKRLITLRPEYKNLL